MLGNTINCGLRGKKTISHEFITDKNKNSQVHPDIEGCFLSLPFVPAWKLTSVDICRVFLYKIFV